MFVAARGRGARLNGRPIHFAIYDDQTEPRVAVQLANQVLSAGVASRWIEALLPVPKAEDVLVSLARRTGDPVRDVSAASFAAVRARLTDSQLIAQLEGDAERDERALGRIYGEGLPSGLVLGAS